MLYFVFLIALLLVFKNFFYYLLKIYPLLLFLSGLRILCSKALQKILQDKPKSA